MEKDRCKLSRPIDGDGRKHLKLMISIVNIRSFNGKLILHFVFVFFFFELLILKTKYKLSTLLHLSKSFGCDNYFQKKSAATMV